MLLVGSGRFPLAHADTKEERSRYWINSGLSWSSGDSVDVRLVEATASNDTTLSDLEIVDSNGDAVALSPSFAADETDYTASVEDGVLQITVTAAASDANNKLDYLDRNGNALRDADTAATGHQVVLDAGETVVQVQVTAEDGTTMTYRASVTRLLTLGATVLVTNLAETLASVASGFNVTGQGFTTGSNPGGYRLTAVVVRVHSHQGGASDSDTHVTLWSNNNGPDAMIAELTTPPLGNGSRTYAASAGVFLDPNRSYHVLVNYGLAQGDRANVRLANSERETSGYGWTIGNSMRFNSPAVPTNWNFNPTPVSMQIEGQELPGVDNTAAVGAPAITGTASLGQMLSAGTAGISDANGKTKADAGDAGYAYANQWQRVDADGSSNPVDIAGATQSTYTVISADVGSKIRVQVNFRDDAGYPEGPLTSNALPAAGTVTCDGLWCATLYVRSLGSGNRGCANSSPDNICSNTAHLSEDAFTHDLTDYAVTSVQVRSDGELRLFLNPDITAGSESLVLHAGSATFAFGDADATGANSRYWDSSGLGWSNGDAVELKLTESGVSTDATLTGLALNDGTTDHTIDLATTPPYTLDVVSAVTTVTLTATPTHTGASVSEVTLGGTEIADTDFTDGITVPSLAEGANVIVVTVTAEDTTTMKTYMVTVTREAAEAAVVWSTTMTVGEVSRGGRGYYLDESDGALIDNSFEIGSTDYQVRALIAGPSYAGVSSTGLAFWTNNTIPSYADYTLEFAGETLPLADATRTISGSGTIYEFLPEWMTANASTLSAANFETTLPVDKEVPACLRTATQVCPGGTTTTSSDATLSGLAVHDGATDHTIDPANTPYTLNVGNAVTTVTLTATPTHTGASVSAVTLGGSAIADTVFTDGITVPSLAEGANVIVVTVTAEDTTTMKTYMVTVTRAATTLTAPAIVANGVQVTSTPTTGDTYGLGETIEITVTFDTAVTVDTSGGTPRIRFILNGGPNPVVAWAEYSSGSGGTALEFTYTVQAGDKDDDGIWLPANFLQLQSGTISDTAYPTVAATLTYARPGTQSGHKVNAPSSDATLSGLAVHDGTTDHTIDLATTPYTLNVGSAVTTVTLTATPAHSGASVSAVTLGGTAIADTVFTDGITVPSLVEGANVIVVTVTAQDTTTTQTYTVTVTRAAAEAAVVWSTTMTVGETTGLGRGYRSSGEVRPGGSLDTDSFTITTGGVPYTVLRLEVSDHQGGVEFKLNSGLSSYADYTLEFAGETLPLVSAANIANNQERFTFNDTWLAANAPSLSLANFETTLAVDKEVPVCLRTATQVCPGGGTTVTNTAATGTPEISGVPQVGQVLTATAGTIADTDGLPSTFPDDYSVQWLRVDADGTSNEEDIAGEIAETYTLTDDDVGKKVKVKVSFTDDLDSTEMRTSAAYPSSGTVAGTNTAPTVSTVAVTSSPASGDTYGTGEMIQFTVTFDQAVTVVGTPEFEFCLGTTATVSCDVGSSPPARRRAALSSGSGTTALVFSYTVVAGDMDDNGIWIGDQSRTIKLDAAGTIQGTVGGLDAVLTHAELGAKTGHKVNGATANTPATGQPEISGTPQVGETLTAATTGITDADGKTNADNGDAGYAYTYEWVRVDADGVSNPTDITGATGSTYPPVEADVDKKVRVKVSFTDDGGTTETVTSDAYPSTGTIIGAGICGRTQEVQDEILEETSSISDCADVERHHLSAFTELYLDNDGITALAAGDFAGLTRVRYLYLHGNDELTSLPEGVFAGLLSLERLSLAGAGLTTLSAGVFEPLTALKFLSLVDNDLRTLTAGVFDGLDALEELKLEENGLTTLPAGVFDGLDALETLSLYGNGLTTLPAGVFDGLDALKTLKLEENGLTTLPAGVFDGLDALETLHLHDNALDALSAGVFEPLTALTELMLEGNPRAPFAPEAVALPDDGTVSDAGGTVTLDGSSSDGGPWGTNVTYGWALPDPASGVTIDDDTSVTPEATIPALTADTELTFTLTVTGRGGENGIAPGTDTATVRVTRADNTAPTAADSSVTIDEDTAHPFAATEFNFADTDPGDALVSVTVVTLPAAGALTLDGTAVTAGRVVPAADIGKLTFTPAANGNGLGYASFTFRVSDGTDESASAYPMTVNVTAVNDPATGKPEISGTPQVGQPLTADVSGIMDADGLTNVSYTYQWYGETQGLSAQISGATLSTYTPVTLDVGKTIKVEVSFTDDAGNAEAPLTSDATATVAVPTAPGVTVSTTALTVTEQDSTGNSYTVVLDTEPTANVVVTVAGHAGTDVTPNPTTLTFTSTIWSTAQTVTVTAGDDADTTDDSVALTHSAASADSGYSGIAIDERGGDGERQRHRRHLPAHACGDRRDP